jgi:hypothetical protein
VDLVLLTYKAGRLPHWVLEVPFLEVLLPSSQCKHSKLLLEAGGTVVSERNAGEAGVRCYGSGCTVRGYLCVGYDLWQESTSGKIFFQELLPPKTKSIIAQS